MTSLKVGNLAPAIEAITHEGKPFRLDALRGQLVVLFFYPRAGTPVCTAETRRFRDRNDEITQLGASVVGVSTDGQQAQCDFATQERVSFPLLVDQDERVCRAYGVKWPLLSRAQRVTFVIDREGLIAARFHHELSAEHHIQGVIDTLKALSAAAPAREPSAAAGDTSRDAARGSGA